MRIVKLSLCVVVAAVFLSSCGSSAPNTGPHTTGLKFRALVSQDVASNLSAPGLIIINALLDVRANAGPISGGSSFLPGQMYLSDNRSITLAVSNLTTQLGIFNNKTEASLGYSSTAWFESEFEANLLFSRRTANAFSSGLGMREEMGRR